MEDYAKSVATTVDGVMPDDVSVINAPTRGPADDEQEIYEDMVTILSTIMNNYYSVPDPNPEGPTIQRRCKYVVMGILAHFYGDLTAHRTLVPTSAIPSNPNNFDSAVQFDLTDFDSPYRGYLISEVNEQKTCFREIPYYKTSGDEEKRKELNGDYTDNEDFFPRRVGLAVHYLKRFFNKLSNGYSEAVIYHKGIYTEFNIEAYDDYYDNIE